MTTQSLLVIGDSFSDGETDFPALIDLPSWNTHTDGLSGRQLTAGLSVFPTAYAACETPPTVLIIALSVNDIILGKADFAMMRDRLRALIEAAKDADGFMGVVVSTAPPFHQFYLWNTGRENVRQQYNAWVRKLVNNGHRMTLLDTDAILSDGIDLDSSYDSGDGLHPNEEGMQAIADSLNASLPSFGLKLFNVVSCYGAEP